MTVDTIEKVKCNGCHTCFNACPKKCIDMKADEEGFLYPAIDKNKCVDCGVCVKSCPVLSKEKTVNEPVAYAVQNKDEFVRMNSSSGGFFTVLAEKVIENNGYVLSQTDGVCSIPVKIKVNKEETVAGIFLYCGISIEGKTGTGQSFFSYSRTFPKKGAKSESFAYIRAFQDIQKELENSFIQEFNAKIKN